MTWILRIFGPTPDRFGSFSIFGTLIGNTLPSVSNVKTVFSSIFSVCPWLVLATRGAALTALLSSSLSSFPPNACTPPHNFLFCSLVITRCRMT